MAPDNNQPVGTNVGQPGQLTQPYQPPAPQPVQPAALRNPAPAVQSVEMPAEEREMRLPTDVVSTSDARRLRRNLAELEDTLQAIRLRTNAPVAKLPRQSRALEGFASTNRLNFLLPEDRLAAASFMDEVLKQAPVLRISFASEASRRFTTELLVWLRGNFHDRLLVEIGLEPAMAAGCVVRTTNKVFDFSLVKHLESQRPLLMEKLLAGSRAGMPPAIPVVEAPVEAVR